MSALVWEPQPDLARRWTAEEDAAMRADYRSLGVPGMAVALTRTESAVRQRAVKLGLARARPARLRALEDARTLDGQVRRLRILLAYRMGVLNEAEAADAARISPGRLPVECAKEAYRGQLEAGPGPERG